VQRGRNVACVGHDGRGVRPEFEKGRRAVALRQFCVAPKVGPPADGGPGCSLSFSFSFLLLYVSPYTVASLVGPCPYGPPYESFDALRTIRLVVPPRSRTRRMSLLSTAGTLIDVVASLPLEPRRRLRACAAFSSWNCNRQSENNGNCRNREVIETAATGRKTSSQHECPGPDRA
jgi:hypothetical protein